MMRFNHMELTLPIGTLTPEFRKDVDGFYVDVLGWKAMDTKVVNQAATCCGSMNTPTQFILLAEYKKPLSSPGYDHMGLLQDTRDEVDELLAKCKEFQEERRSATASRSTRIWSTRRMTVHAFYFKYLLPIWFDVQCMERDRRRHRSRLELGGA